MAHNLQDGFPLGGLDYDSSDEGINHGPNGEKLPTNNYRYAKNIRAAINASFRGKKLTNVKGNVQITKYTLPYSGGVWPAGTNKVLGFKEDVNGNTILYFVWNSAGNHQILQYFRGNTDVNNPYGEIQQVMMFNFGWQQNQRITGVNLISNSALVGGTQGSDAIGNLLYFTDPVPHKINVTKANVCTKNKTWFFTSGQYNSFAAGGNFQLQLFDFNNISLFNNSVSFGAYNNPNLSTEQNITAAWLFIATAINANFGGTFLATACNCGMTIEVLNNAGWKLSSSFNVLYWPDNWYGPNPIAFFFDRCKWPALMPSLPLYKQDVNYLPNYVQKKVFQHRLGLRTDDLEQTVYGVWSQIATNNLTCAGIDNPDLNYIDVNFNFPILQDPNHLVLIKHVDFVSRELNTGSDRSIKVLEPCDWLDYDTVNNVWFSHFKFYNDITPITIDADRAAVIFDNVPLTAQEELEVENRMIETNVVTGYNAPECPQVQIQVQVDAEINPPLFKVRVGARILSFGLILQDQRGNNSNVSFAGFYPGASPYPFVNFNPNQPQQDRGGIFRNVTANTSAFFGGGNFDSNGAFGITDGMETSWDQRLGSNGFVFYTAGQQYYGITKQILVGLPTDTNNCMDTSNPANIQQIGNYYQSTAAHLIQQGNPIPDMYSEGFLLLPPGTYVIRMASHWCSPGDVLGKGYMYDLNNGLSYQKTSTNVGGVFITGGFAQQQEIVVTVTNSDIDAGDFVIVDLTPPVDFKRTGGGSDKWNTINMYLVDSDPFGTNPNALNFEAATIEKALVFQSLENTTQENLAIENWRWGSVTDHNGYWFGINSDGGVGAVFTAFSSNGVAIGNEISHGQVYWSGTLTDLYNKTLTSVDALAIQTPSILWFGVITTTIPTARSSSSTLIEGFVKDSNGNPITGAIVVYQNGRYTTTLQDGSYEMLAWGDLIQPNLLNFAVVPGLQTPSPVSPGPGRFIDALIYQLPASCSGTYPIGVFQFALIQNLNGLPYSPTVPYVAPQWTINEGATPEQKALKRGGRYLICGRWYDNAGRCCSVVELFDLYVPFETEDLSLYPYVVQANGTPYPAGSFVPGKPTVNWTLITPPPIWAAYFQWMITPNMIAASYLQFALNQVTYLSQIGFGTIPEITTAFANGDATAIKFNLDNILVYQQRNAGVNNGSVSYAYVETQRMRLIYDRFLNLITGLHDFEIIGNDGTNLNIYVQYNGQYNKEILSGTLVEIYLPLSLETTNEQIEYEFGEVVPCTAPGSSNNLYSFTVGFFKGGDTYWRERNIPVNDPASDFNVTYPIVIEDASKSDFYPSLAWDRGRLGTIDPNFVQQSDSTRLYASDVFLNDTAVNGLSAFTPLPGQILEVILDRKFGGVQRLFYEQNLLLAVCSTKEVSLYIYRDTLYNAQNPDGVQAVSNNFFGTQYKHTQNLGTDEPAVCVTNSGNVFGTRFNVANAWKFENNGERVISDIWMISFFQQLKNDGVVDAVAIYDRYYEEYIMTYWRNYTVVGTVFAIAVQLPVQKPGQPQNFNGTLTLTWSILLPGAPPPVGATVTVQIPLQAGGFAYYTGMITSVTPVYLLNSTTQTGWTVSGVFGFIYPPPLPAFKQPTVISASYSLPETLAWNEGTKEQKLHNEAQVWRGFYDFTPECYATLNTELFSFLNGRLWIHDKNSLYNNFYGVQYPSYITPVFNDNPSIMKVWNAIWMIQYQADGKCNWQAFNITNDQGQLSRLQAANFIQKQKNNWYQQFKGDLTDITVTNPIVNGRRLRSNALVVAFQNDSTGEIVLQEWRANETPSFRTIQ